MTDQNSVILRGSLAGVNPRRIGQQDRVLYEVHVSLTKPAARGREAEVMVVPVTVWAPELGLALETLEPGTPVTVIGRVSARSWTPAGGGAERIFTEVIGESVLVDATLAAAAEPEAVSAPSRSEPPPVSRKETPPAPRPGGPGRGRPDSEPPF